MLNYTKTPYTLNSSVGSVQACLRKKIEVSQPRANGGILGIGASSCCSYISYVDEGRVDNVFGNSRIRIPFQVNGVEVRTACAHGELTALWNLLEECQPRMPTILEMYIEMSPCSKCSLALSNLVFSGTIHYSFDHGAETAAWQTAARALCS